MCTMWIDMSERKEYIELRLRQSDDGFVIKIVTTTRLLPQMMVFVNLIWCKKCIKMFFRHIIIQPVQLGSALRIAWLIMQCIVHMHHKAWVQIGKTLFVAVEINVTTWGCIPQQCERVDERSEEVTSDFGVRMGGNESVVVEKVDQVLGALENVGLNNFFQIFGVVN